MTTTTPASPVECPICGYAAPTPRAEELGRVQGNTGRFKHTEFRLWKCPECQTIVSLDPADLRDIYSDYPLNQRQLDVFARGTLANLRRRLEDAGMRPEHSILDYGCGNGLFVDYLQQTGYPQVTGYDPYVAPYERLPEGEQFDVVVNNDTLEHCEDLRGMIRHSLDLVKPGGLLYLGTADSEPVEMDDLQPHVMRLHQPYHRVIITESSLHRLAGEFEAEIVASYRRSYHDTRRPFSNYRFLDELNRAVGHDLDLALDPAATNRAFLHSPRLWFFALFGYWFPSAAEPAIVLRKAAAAAPAT